MHWDLRQKPEELQLTSALCPISSLPVTSSLLFKLQGSYSASLRVEFILNKCFVWLEVLKEKKNQSLTLKIRFHIKFPLSSFPQKLKIWNTSQLGNIQSREKATFLQPAVPKVSTHLVSPTQATSLLLCATEFLNPALPLEMRDQKVREGCQC